MKKKPKRMKTVKRWAIMDPNESMRRMALFRLFITRNDAMDWNESGYYRIARVEIREVGK